MSGQANLFHILKERVEKLYLEGNFDEAGRVAETALDSARRMVENTPEDPEPVIEALEMLGDLNRHRGNFPEAEELYLEALRSANGQEVNTDLAARLQSSLGGLYDFNGLEDQAAPLYEEAIRLFEALDPPQLGESANLRNNLGMIYKGFGDTGKAEEHYLSALQIFEQREGKESEPVAAVYNNLGALYTQAGLFDQAREMHIAALDLRSKLHGVGHSDISQSHSNLAIVYHQMGQDQQAADHFEEALRILEGFIDAEPGEYALVAENYAALLRNAGEEKTAASLEKKTRKTLKKHGFEIEGQAA